MAKSKKIVFTGGGTVGHVTLNLILIPKFLKDGWEVHYIGDKLQLLLRFVPKHSFQKADLYLYRQLSRLNY